MRKNLITFLRTARSALTTQAAANGLFAGEPYFLTDEGRLAVATGSSAFVEMALRDEGIAGAHGQCRLIKDGANLKLMPHNGNKLRIAGRVCVIPSAGLSLAPETYSPNLTYYIYAVSSDNVNVTGILGSGTPPIPSTTPGNEGVMVSSGVESRTLVGMARAVAGPTWVDSQAQRFVLSYFNRQDLQILKTLQSEYTTSSTSYVAVPGLSAEMLTWPDEMVELFFNGIVYHTVGGLGNYIYAIGAIDSVTQTDGGGSLGEVVGAGAYAPMSFDFSAMLSQGYHSVDVRARTNAGAAGFSGAAGFRCAIKGSVRG